VSIKRVNRGKGHSYLIDGRKADGVTTAIKKALPAPALMYWSARTVAEYVADADEATLATLRSLGRNGMVAALKETPWTARDKAAARGTEVHALGEKLIHGTEVEVPEHLAGHVEAYVKFLDDWKPEPILVEATVAHRKWNYAGTLDQICRLPDGRLVIADIKTAASGIWPETSYQLAAYRYAEVYLDTDGNEQPMPAVEAGYAIWVRADGYDLIPVRCDEQVWKDFLHLLWVARAIERNKDVIGEAVQP
jgi:hypothetical protein